MIRIILPIFLVIMVSGCGTLNSVYRPFNINDTAFNNSKGALIDIKQRAILVKKKTIGTGAEAKEEVIACAEPSPDAMSAYATEFAAKADTPGKTAAELSSATQESAAFTGLRTQSIQLLRDSLYRACEAYMNGAITQEAYDINFRRYQKDTVALLAIEQLTGTIKAPVVTINTAGSAEAARSISEMRSEIASIDKKIADIEAKAKVAGVTADQQSKYEAEIKALKEDRGAIEKGIAGAKGVLATGSASATVSSIGMPNQRGDDHIQAIAGTVERIVLSVINREDTGQLCFSYLKADPAKLNSSAKDLQAVCLKEFQTAAALRETRVTEYARALDEIGKSTKTPEEKAKARDDLDKKSIDVIKPSSTIDMRSPF